MCQLTSRHHFPTSLCSECHCVTPLSCRSSSTIADFRLDEVRCWIVCWVMSSEPTIPVCENQLVQNLQRSWLNTCIGRAIYFWIFSRQVLDFLGFLVLCFPVSLIFCFSAFLLFLSCFSAFPASLLFAFPASLLFCFSVCAASLLLYFCAFLLLLFYFFFSSVMCFCCSTSCWFASWLPVFTVSLFFMFFWFILFCLHPKWNPKETLGP